MGKFKTVCLMFVLISLQACISLSAKDQLIGQWQSELGGFPIVVSYSETTVKVGSHEEVPYLLEGEQLSFADGGSQVILISFTNKNEMIQENQLTGSRQVLTRISP